MSNLVSTIVFLAVVGGLAWVGWGLEPHWSSKDGRKFMCRMLEHSAGTDDSARGRWHDVKVGVNEDELFVYARSRRSASLRGNWKVIGVTDDPKKHRRFTRCVPAMVLRPSCGCLCEAAAYPCLMP